MIPILLNAKLTTSGDGYVRQVTFEFTHGSRRKHEAMRLEPGMTRKEVANRLRSAASDIEKLDEGNPQAEILGKN